MEQTPTSWWTLATSCLLIACLRATCALENITEGTNFMFAFPENLPQSCDFYLFITSKEPEPNGKLNITVQSAKSGRNQEGSVPMTIPLRSNSYFTWPNSTSSSQNNIVQVSTNRTNVSIVARILCNDIISGERKMGEFLAIPTQYWGMKYVIASPANLTCGYTTLIIGNSSEFTITAIWNIRGVGSVVIEGAPITENTTTFTVVFGKSTEIHSCQVDISGTLLKSNQPIGVIVGPGNGACNRNCSEQEGIFLEQLVPTYAWGNEFYLRNGSTSADVTYNYSYRIVTCENGTKLFFNYTDDKFSNSISLSNAGSVFDYTTSAWGAYDILVATNSVLVAMYVTANATFDGAWNQISPAAFKRFGEVILKSIDEDNLRVVHLVTTEECLQTIISDSLPEDETNTNVVKMMDEGCTGMSSYVISAAGDERQSLASYFMSWPLECLDNEKFDNNQRMCVPYDTTTTSTTSSTRTMTSAATTTSSPITTTSTTTTAVTTTNNATTAPTSTSSSTTTTTTTGAGTTPGNTTITSTTTTTSKMNQTPDDPKSSTHPLNSTTSEEIDRGTGTHHFHDHSHPNAAWTTPASRMDEGNPNKPYPSSLTPGETPKAAGTTKSWRPEDDNISYPTSSQPFPETTSELLTTINSKSMTSADRSEQTTPDGPHLDSNSSLDGGYQATRKQCPCPCSSKTGETIEEMKKRIEREIAAVEKNLKVHVPELSQTRRALTSANDDRPSAVCLGMSGALILAGMLALLVLMDFMHVYHFLGFCDRRAPTRNSNAKPPAITG